MWWEAGRKVVVAEAGRGSAGMCRCVQVVEVVWWGCVWG